MRAYQRVGNAQEGYIAFIEDFPFAIRRIYWMVGIDHEKIRGQHAHKNLHQLIFAVQGAIEFTIESQRGEKYYFTLNSPELGLYIPPMHWRTARFGQNAILLCLASDVFSEEDYIRDYEAFKKLS